MASPRISSEEALAIVEKQRQERLESTKNFLTGFAKNFTTDLPGFLMDVADKLAGDTATLGEKDRSAQLFESMTGIKTKSGDGGVDELVGSLINPIGAAKAVIVPAVVAGKTFKQVREAQELLDTGTDVSTVFEKTGIFPGIVDSRMRAVISDEGAKLKYGDNLVTRRAGVFTSSEGPTQMLGLGMWGERTLGDILDHPELFKAVPQLKDIPVGATFGGYGGGAYHPTTNKIFMDANKSEKDYLSVLLHETQHAIQQEYMLPQGGNSGMFFNDREAFDKAKEVLRNVDAAQSKSPNRSDEILALIGDNRNALNWAETNAYQNYKNIAGEAEARAVQELFLNPKKAHKVPYDYYDSPLGELIANPSSVPKVDSDPVVKAILDFIERNPEFGKLPEKK